MKKLRCVIMRGGTSKGVFFHENELPQDPQKRKEVILRVFGSPDKRQIDGLGGAEILTSKAAIIGPPSRNDADVDYIFGQVGIEKPEIDFSAICGNLSAAVGPFAIDEGLVEAKEPITNVRVFCPILKRYLATQVEVRDGRAVYDGDFKIDGVPGTGSKISVDYSDSAGFITGHLLPTGNRTDVLEIKGLGKIEVSMVDAACLSVFVKACDLGLDGSESPNDFDTDKNLLDTLEKIRLTVAQLTNLGESSVQPLVAIVQKPVPWVSFVSGNVIKAEEADVLSKIYTPGRMHKAYPGTGCVSTGAAAKIRGTIVHELLSEAQKTKDTFVIGHFSGVMPVEVEGREEDGTIKLEKAIIYRTARRIMEGYVYV